ncbi:MAG: hypothetical protein ACLFQS_03485 [Bacteroidales bacterium]
MRQVIEELKSLRSEEIEPNNLKIKLSKFDFTNVEYLSFLEDKGFDDYYRVVIMDSPLRVILNVWPPQYQLPTHQHNNFWGYVAVLKGLITETAFVFDSDSNQLLCHPPKSYQKGEVIFEPLNVIHHLQNPSPSKPLVTAHFYYPRVYDYNGTMIFDLKKRILAELNEKAPGVSWNHPAEFYSRIEEQAFDVVNLW